MASRTAPTQRAVLVMALATVFAATAHAFPHGHGCGINHPHVHEQAAKHDAVVVPQSYHTHESARRLVTQTYATGTGGGFLPIDTAESQGLTAPIRIKVLWDVIEGTDYSGTNAGSNARQCTSVGASVRVACQVGSSINCPWSDCAAEDVVAAGHAKLALMKERLEWVKTYFSNALRVKRVLDDIQISSSVVNTFNLGVNKVSNADLAIIMTARPMPYHKLAGFAYCAQRDQLNRCTVGVFNWVPKVLDVANKDLPSSAASERHTAIHEIVHVLGGIFPNGPHIDDSGAIKTSGVYIVERDSQGYDKPATKVVTPRVLKIVRDQFDCQTMTGMPIEDQPTGKGAHWEARIMGPEVMSYGTGTGEVYMSDLTFAYLEDTNQYRANYSFTGPLIVTTGDTGQKLDFKVDSTLAAKDLPAPLSPGYLRWGRHQGCDFVQQKATQWSDNYQCKQHREFACTFDHRLSAVCDIKSTWTLGSQYTCGTFSSGRTQCGVKLNDNCIGSFCKLPTPLQHFNAETAKAATGKSSAPADQTGGFSSAMDFAPVRIGYWSCQDAKPSGNASTQLEREAGTLDMSSLTQGAEENMQLFGGQAYCPSCRCFVSSLMEFSSGNVNPDFPRFGLCYRSNCYKANYLQFGIKDQIGGDVTWYKCPLEGGKLYIAGFTGAFHCPKATEFCEFEEITGVKYSETEVIWEWVLSSLFFALPIFLVLCCLCCGDYFAEKVKTAIGVHFFENPAENDEHGREKPPPIPSRMLLCVNACTGCFGMGVLLVTMGGIATGRISAAASLLLSFGSFVLFVSCLGGCGATRRAKGASCILLTYFYTVAFCAAGYFFFVCWAWIYTEAFDKKVARHWDTIVDALPEDLLLKNEHYETATGIIEGNQGIAVGVALFILVLIVVAVAASIMIISAPVLMATLFMVANYSFVMTGIVILGSGIYSLVLYSGIETGLNVLVALFICLGLYIALNSVLAIIGGFKKSLGLLKTSLAMFLLSFVFQTIAAAMLFTNSDTITDLVDGLSDEDLARFTQTLGMTGLSKAEVGDIMQLNIRSLALASLCWIATLIVTIGTNIYFIAAVRKERRLARVSDQMQAEMAHVVPSAPKKRKNRKHQGVRLV